MSMREWIAALCLSLGLCAAGLLLVPFSWAAPLLDMGTPVIEPEANLNTVPVTTSIGISYGEPISATTVSTRTFPVHGTHTGLVSGTYSTDGGTITLVPSAAFHPGELVCAMATTGTLSLGGTEPVSPTVWQFRTAVDGGSAVLADSGQRLGSSGSGAPVLGDLDRDGDLDVVVANWYEGADIWLNDGRGLMSYGGLLSAGYMCSGVGLGDVDADGDLDAFLAYYGANWVWLNDGSGSFSDSGQRLGTGSGVDAVLGDLDGDGDLDAFVANAQWEGGEVWLNDGSGVLSDSGQSLGIGYSMGVALGDLDGDGDLDVYVANALSPNPEDIVWLNDGTGAFSPSGQNFASQSSYCVELGDLDGDGDLDAYVGRSGQDTVLLNDGHATFSSRPASATWGITGFIALGDLDGDGDLDGVGIRDYGGSYAVLVNDGAGSFTETGQMSGPDHEAGFALGDLDGDGDLDCYLAISWSEPDWVFFNASPADLEISKTDGLMTVAPGEAISYTIVVSNNGPTLAYGVTVSDVVPASLMGVEWSAVPSAGSSCSPCSGAGSVVWPTVDLPVGGDVTLTVSGTVSLAPTVPLANTAYVTVPDWIQDGQPENNSATDDTSLAPLAVDDEPGVDEDCAPTVFNVLDNDSTYPDVGETLAVVAVGARSQGGIVTNSVSSLLYSPFPDFFGTEVFTYTASDGRQGLDTATVTVTVGAVNDTPVISDFAKSGTEDLPVALASLDFTDHFGDVDPGDALISIRIDACPSYGVLKLNGSPVSPGQEIPETSLDDLVYVPEDDHCGDDGFTWNASDGETSAEAAAEVEFLLTCLNDGPVNTVPGPQVVRKNIPFVLGTAAGNAIAISDVDAADNPVLVSLTAMSGTLSLSGTAGLTLVTGDGIEDPSIVFTATLADSNIALDGITFTPFPDYVGPASIAVSTDDQGATGVGGHLTDTDAVEISVEDYRELSVSKSGRANPWYVGWNLGYDIYITNTGTLDLSGVTITDHVPSPWCYATDDHDGVWELGDLVVGASEHLEITIRSRGNTPSGTTITNTVEGSADLLWTTALYTDTTLLLDPPFAATSTPTSTPTPTATATATASPTSTATETATPTPTGSTTAIYTATPTATSTPTATATATPESQLLLLPLVEKGHWSPG